MHLLVIALSLGLLGAGCSKSGDNTSPGKDQKVSTPAKPTPAAETIGKIHWLGKDRLAASTNVDTLMGIWGLTESTNLEAQTLAKLATAPWRLISGAPEVATAPVSLLSPLLKDLLDKEVLVEVRQTEEQPGALVLAVRVDAAKSALWATNLAAVAGSLAGSQPTPEGTNGWILQKAAAPNIFELQFAGDWVVVGISQSSNRFAGEIAQRLLKSSTLLADTNYFISLDLDLPRISRAFELGWNFPSEWPRITLTLNGEGESVRTRAELVFPHSLPFQVEAWNIPTNLVFDPLLSFTAVQGIAPWLNTWPAYQNLHLGPAPNQMFLWAQNGIPFQSYVAAAVPNSATLISNLVQTLSDQVNPWMTNHAAGYFDRGTNAAEVVWSEVPFMSPFLRAAPPLQTNFVFGGLIGVLSTNRSAPPELLKQFETKKDLVGYDWEVTGPRIQQWLYFGQLIRFALSKAQIPPSSAGFAWLRSLESRLGNSGTTLSLTGPNRLTLVRNSGAGFSSAELLWLVDWLESPSFPKGLNTFTGKPELLKPRAGKQVKAEPLGNP